jgi:hypothetical protein
VRQFNAEIRKCLCFTMCNRHNKHICVHNSLKT